MSCVCCILVSLLVWHHAIAKLDNGKLNWLIYQNWKKFNNGHTLVLIVIDVFSKFAWAESLKNKTSKRVLKAFAKVVNRSARKPLILYTDRGLEFTKKLYQRWLKKKYFHFLTSQNQETKAAIAERLITTLLVSNLVIFHIQTYQKIHRRASRLFTISQCKIAS